MRGQSFTCDRKYQAKDLKLVTLALPSRSRQALSDRTSSTERSYDRFGDCNHQGELFPRVIGWATTDCRSDCCPRRVLPTPGRRPHRNSSASRVIRIACRPHRVPPASHATRIVCRPYHMPSLAKPKAAERQPATSRNGEIPRSAVALASSAGSYATSRITPRRPATSYVS
nr:hypothetical protein Ade03nite_64740 [Actinoplanes derwentensis]